MAVVAATGRPGDSSSHESHAAPYTPAAARPSPLPGAPSPAPAATAAAGAGAQSCDAELECVLLSDLHVCDDMDVAADAGAAGVGTEGLRAPSAGSVSAASCVGANAESAPAHSVSTSSYANANGASGGRGGGPGGANAGRGVTRRRFERTEGLLVEKRVWDERGDAGVEGGSPKRKQLLPSSLPHDARQAQARAPAADRGSETVLPGAASGGGLGDGSGDPSSAGQQKHPQPRQSSPLPPSPPPTRLPQDAQERGDIRASKGGPVSSPTAHKPGRGELGQSAAAALACGPRDPSQRPSLNAGLFQGPFTPPSDGQLLPEVAMSAGTKSPAEAAVEAVNAAVAAGGDDTGLGAEETGSNCIQS